MLEIVKEIIISLKDKGLKWMLSISIMMLVLLLFISPVFLFLFCYKRSFLSTNIVEIVLVVLVLSTILFLFVFIVSSGIIASCLLKKELKVGKKILGEERNKIYIIKTLIVSLFTMGVIAIILFCGKIINEFSAYEMEFKLGIYLLLVTIFVHIIIGVLSWIYVLVAKNISEDVKKLYNSRSANNLHGIKEKDKEQIKIAEALDDTEFK